MTIILQSPEQAHLCEVAIERSPSEARELVDLFNLALAELALLRVCNRGVVAVAIPEEVPCS